MLERHCNNDCRASLFQRSHQASGPRFTPLLTPPRCTLLHEADREGTGSVSGSNYLPLSSFERATHPVERARGARRGGSLPERGGEGVGTVVKGDRVGSPVGSAACTPQTSSPCVADLWLDHQVCKGTRQREGRGRRARPLRRIESPWEEIGNPWSRGPPPGGEGEGSDSGLGALRGISCARCLCQFVFVFVSLFVRQREWARSDGNCKISRVCLYSVAVIICSLSHSGRGRWLC
ncbi:hypothetical protein FA95DRAFT_654584 [Auriscalpium vulgare]|uniref:Uncharacterized protein n=1 Tax=Auriscalpium vulgare TaxID=40419 RepID=A0ACB8RCG1_9AGAM|nr:hypothetical protein FA95DRAFT_654584 [Auriscalpium vulgare]